MSISDIATVAIAVATVIGAAVTAGPAAIKRGRQWVRQRDQGRRKWNALEATVETDGSKEFLYQLKNRSGKWREHKRMTGPTRTCITRESCLLLAETEQPTRLTIKNEGEGTIILRTGRIPRNVKPRERVELRKGFGGASIYMRKAKRVRTPSTPDLSSGA